MASPEQVQRVKAAQRSSNHWREEWATYCESESAGGMRDPAQLSSEFVQQFIDRLDSEDASAHQNHNAGGQRSRPSDAQGASWSANGDSSWTDQNSNAGASWQASQTALWGGAAGGPQDWGPASWAGGSWGHAGSSAPMPWGGAMSAGCGGSSM